MLREYIREHADTPPPRPGRYVALHPPRLKNVTALPLRFDHFVRDAYVRWSLSAPLFRAAFGFCGFQALSRGTSLDFTQGKAALLLAPLTPDPMVKNSKITISQVAEIYSYHSIQLLTDQRAFSLHEECGRKV